MKELIKSTGILVVLVGIIVLVLSVLKSLDNNVWLGISGILIVGGLIIHIFLNRYLN